MSLMNEIDSRCGCTLSEGVGHEDVGSRVYKNGLPRVGTYTMPTSRLVGRALLDREYAPLSKKKSCYQ